GVSGEALAPGTIGTAVLGLVLCAALWWTYFAEDEQRGEATLVAGSLNDRVRMALHGYFYAYIPMLLGVIALAAGVKLTIGGVGARLTAWPAGLLAGGVALYLLGDVAFRRALRIRPLGYRVVGAAAALATVLLGVSFSGLTQLVGLVAVLVAVLLV